jgi:hypothetical protein
MPAQWLRCSMSFGGLGDLHYFLGIKAIQFEVAHTIVFSGALIPSNSYHHIHMPFFSKSSSDSSSVRTGSSAASLLHKADSRSTNGGKGNAPSKNPASSSPDHSSQSVPSTKTQYLAKDFGAVSNKYGAIGYGGMTSGI